MKGPFLLKHINKTNHPDIVKLTLLGVITRSKFLYSLGIDEDSKLDKQIEIYISKEQGKNVLMLIPEFDIKIHYIYEYIPGIINKEKIFKVSIEYKLMRFNKELFESNFEFGEKKTQDYSRRDFLIAIFNHLYNQ